MGLVAVNLTTKTCTTTWMIIELMIDNHEVAVVGTGFIVATILKLHNHSKHRTLEKQ